MRNIALIGMPASGKSTVGVVLAKVMRFGFVDTDILLQEKAGMTLEMILSERGLEGFKKFENDAVRDLRCKRKVIATGGSVIYGREAVENIKRISLVIYLRQSFGTIEARLRDIRGRGVAIAEGQSLRDLYEERVPLYEEAADIAVDSDDMSVEDTAELIRMRAEPLLRDGN